MKSVVHVVHNPNGWWDVRDEQGEVLARYVSEFQAWEAGRVAAERLECDLALHQHGGPIKYEIFDFETKVCRPLGHNHAPPVNRTPSESRKLILLVEDLVDAREMYAQYLNYAGFSVVTAINGHEAVRLAALLRPDLILMDIRMPGMDGLEATADLKSTPELAHIPIVALTGDLSDDVSTRAREAGCAACLAKPTDPDEVARQIRMVLEGKGSGARIAAPGSPTS